MSKVNIVPEGKGELLPGALKTRICKHGVSYKLVFFYYKFTSATCDSPFQKPCVTLGSITLSARFGNINDKLKSY